MGEILKGYFSMTGFWHYYRDERDFDARQKTVEKFASEVTLLTNKDFFFNN